MFFNSVLCALQQGGHSASFSFSILAGAMSRSAASVAIDTDSEDGQPKQQRESAGSSAGAGSVCFLCLQMGGALTHSIRGFPFHHACSNTCRSYQNAVRKIPAAVAEEKRQFYNEPKLWRESCAPFAVSEGDGNAYRKEAIADMRARWQRNERYTDAGQMSEGIPMTKTQYLTWKRDVEESSFNELASSAEFDRLHAVSKEMNEYTRPVITVFISKSQTLTGNRASSVSESHKPAQPLPEARRRELVGTPSCPSTLVRRAGKTSRTTDSDGRSARQNCVFASNKVKTSCGLLGLC
jgi:hypothetical protein